MKRRGWGSAVKTLYNGVLYDSKAEAAYAKILDAETKAGQIKRWGRQQRWPLKVNGIPICTMIPDFVVWRMDDGLEVMELHEVKGYETPIFRLKRKLFEALHPEVNYIVIPAKGLS